MRKNSNNCLGACDSTEVRCLGKEEGIPTSKIVTNSVGLFFEFMLDNVEKESSGCTERVESPSQWFIRGWKDNYDQIMKDIRDRKARKLYAQCYNTLRERVSNETKGTPICIPTERVNRKSKPLPTNYDEQYLLGDHINAESNKNNNSSSEILVLNNDDNLASGRKEKKVNKRKSKREKENKKEMKKHELPNSLTGTQFNTGNVLPQIRQHVEREHASEAEYDTPFKDTNDMIDKINRRTSSMINSPQHQPLIQDVQEVGKTEEQKFFQKDKRILSSIIKKINQQSEKKLCPMVMEDEDPAAVKFTKESILDVVKLRGQFNNKCAMLPQIGQTSPKDDIGHIMQVNEQKMEIRDKKNQFSKDLIINMKRLRKERIEEYVNKMEAQVSCSNPHGDGNMENMPTFAPQPPQGNPNPHRRGRRFKPSSQIPDENLLYVPNAPGHDD